MPNTLRLTLFGVPQLHSDDQPLRFPTNKTRALLVYLAVENGRFHSRSSLVDLLWPTSSERQGRQNLSQTLRRLRLTVDKAQPNLAAQTLQTTSQAVRLAPSDKLFCDVVAFQQLVARTTTHTHEAISHCATCLTWLETAVSLYRDDFLADFTLPDAAPFEAWASTLRSQLQHQAVQALDTLIVAATQQSDIPQLERYARQQILLEPWRDKGWHYLLLALVQSNRHHEAIQHYRHYRQNLQQELGVEPGPALRQFASQLQAGTLPSRLGLPQPQLAWQSFLATRQQVQPKSLRDFDVSQAGDKLLALGADGRLRLWDVATGQRLWVFAGQQTAVTCIALSPNGRLAAAGNAHGQITCWQTNDGTITQQWTASAAPIHQLTFLPHTQTLLGIAGDGALRLWTLLDND